MAKHQKKGCSKFKKIKDSKRLFRIYNPTNEVKTSPIVIEPDENVKENIVKKRIIKQIEKKKKKVFVLNKKSQEKDIKVEKIVPIEIIQDSVKQEIKKSEQLRQPILTPV